MSNFNFNFTNHGLSPCKGCKNRRDGCHSICEEYINFSKKCQEENDKEWIYKSGYSYTPWRKPSNIERIERKRKNG